MADGKAGAPKGNNNASKGKSWAEAIRRAVLKRDAEGKRKLYKLAEKLVEEGLDGDLIAIKEIGDRLDGKPAQVVQRTDNRTITLVQRTIVAVEDKSQAPIEGQAERIEDTEKVDLDPVKS